MINCLPPGVLVTSFVPLPINITPGSSTRQGTQVRLGKWIEVQIKMTSAASFVMSNGPSFYKQVTALLPGVVHSETRAHYRDGTPVAEYPGYSSSATSQMVGSVSVHASNSTYATQNNASGTAPFTWATTSDVIHVANRSKEIG